MDSRTGATGPHKHLLVPRRQGHLLYRVGALSPGPASALALDVYKLDQLSNRRLDCVYGSESPACSLAQTVLTTPAAPVSVLRPGSRPFVHTSVLLWLSDFHAAFARRLAGFGPFSRIFADRASIDDALGGSFYPRKSMDRSCRGIPFFPHFN